MSNDSPRLLQPPAGSARSMGLAASDPESQAAHALVAEPHVHRLRGVESAAGISAVPAACEVDLCRVPVGAGDCEVRRAPIQRKTPLRAKAPMRKRSKAKGPTKAECARMGTIKRMQCLACRINGERGMPSAYIEGCDAHHLLSGGRRIGHAATIALCPWHHRGVKPYDGMTDAQATEYFGPSLAHGSKPFREAYGTDGELLAMQERELKRGNAE